MNQIKRTENICTKCSVGSILHAVGLKGDLFSAPAEEQEQQWPERRAAAAAAGGWGGVEGGLKEDDSESFLDELAEPAAMTRNRIGLFNGHANHLGRRTLSGASPPPSFENQLTVEGVAATMYLPTRRIGGGQKKAIPHPALVRRHPQETKMIDCEVLTGGSDGSGSSDSSGGRGGGNRRKKFRFTLDDVLAIHFGRGTVAGIQLVPAEVDEGRCACFDIRGKGELNLVLASEEQRDFFVNGFREMVESGQEQNMANN